MSDLRSRFAELGSVAATHAAPPPPLAGLVARAAVRRRHRRQVVGAAVATAAVVVALGATSVRDPGRDPGLPLGRPLLTPEQVADLTAVGSAYSPEELAPAVAALKQQWARNPDRPWSLAAAVQVACDARPDSCGGLYYERGERTYFLRLVRGAPEAAELGLEANAAYTALRRDTGYRLETVAAAYSLTEATALVAEINEPDRRRPEVTAAGFEEGSFSAGYVPSDGVVRIVVTAPEEKVLFEDLYGDRVTVGYPTPDMAFHDGFAPR